MYVSFGSDRSSRSLNLSRAVNFHLSRSDSTQRAIRAVRVHSEIIQSFKFRVIHSEPKILCLVSKVFLSLKPRIDYFFYLTMTTLPFFSDLTIKGQRILIQKNGSFEQNLILTVSTFGLNSNYFMDFVRIEYAITMNVINRAL